MWKIVIGCILFTGLAILSAISVVACGEPAPSSAPPSPTTVAPLSPTSPFIKIATVEYMWVSNNTWRYDYALCVELKPTNFASANKSYIVELYEKNHLRNSTNVSWNQPEINVLKDTYVCFPITESEYDAYYLEDISHIFSISVRE